MQDVGYKRTVVVAPRKQPSLRPSEPPVRAYNLQENGFRHAQSGGIDRGQRGTAFEARDRLQEAHDLVGAQHDRQLARLTRIGDALWNRVLAERYAIEEPQRADDLIERRP